jgi:hypothetical protein
MLAFTALHLSPHALQLFVVLSSVQVVPPQSVSLHVHAPALQSGVGCAHVAPFTQLPVGPQLCGVLPLHCTCPGPHSPWHAPITQVWLVHGDVGPQAPVAALQLCTEFPLHCVSAGAQTPWQLPMMHVWCTHVEPFTQVPPAPHDCGMFPLHCTWAGEQTPWQLPPEHVWFTQAVGAPHVPEPVQV